MNQLINDENAKKNPMGDDTKYSRAIKVPQYIPKDEQPKLESLYDTKKYNKLMARIKKSNVSDEEKLFLQLGATRHIVFSYSKIADYYAHASAEMQELMEESALIILDMDDAIANGYVALSERMQQLVDEEKAKQKAKEEVVEEEFIPEDLVDEDEVEEIKINWKLLRPVKKETVEENEE